MGQKVCKHTHGELGLAAAAAHHLLLTLPGLTDGSQQTAAIMAGDILTEPLPIATGPSWGLIERPGLGARSTRIGWPGATRRSAATASSCLGA